MDALPTLLVLAIGLVLGALCCAVWLRLLRVAAAADDARSAGAHATGQVLLAIKHAMEAKDQLNTHDHEIAALYARAGMKRG